MRVNPSIFKAYDIRGAYPGELNAKSAYIITRSFVDFLRAGDEKKELTVVVAHDARQSSPELKRAVIDALAEESVRVLDMSYATSPFYYFTVTHTGADGGVMVTASHDPCSVNGLKLTKKNAEHIVGDEMEIIKKAAVRAIFRPKQKNISVETVAPHHEYIKKILSVADVSGIEGKKIVLDAGGGTSAVLIKYLVRELKCDIRVIGDDMFCDPYKNPFNPMLEEDLARIKNAVLSERADFGVAFDADGDRSGFVTENARFFRADYMGAFIARELLRQYPGEKILYDVRSSSIVRETVKAAGGIAVESRVGHSFIKRAMRSENILFGAELSGHFYFRDFFFHDSTFLAFLFFLQFLSESQKTADKLLDEFAVYPSSGELSFKLDKKEGLLENIAEKYKDAKETKWVDGVSVYYDDWWANVRISNTEALVRLNVEARTKELLDEKVKELEDMLNLGDYHFR